jgi:SAM-dependent methyltransferase
MSKKAKLAHAITGLFGAQGSYSPLDALSFVKQFREFSKLGGTSNTVEPILLEKSESAGSANGHYFHQDLLVAKLIHDDAPDRHIDIGSRIDGFVAHVASFRKIEILDVRPLKNTGHPNIEFRKVDLMKLDLSLIDSCDSISCLHAIEHFGLGRYGDALNPNGHIVGFQNIVKMLKPGGRLYISFPIATQTTVIFNKHRIFSPYDIFSWPTLGCTLKLVQFDYVDDAGDLHQGVNLNTENIIAKYGCGIYTFEKLIGQVDPTPEAISAATPKPQFSFLMDPGNREGAGSFYQRPFLASLMADSLGAQFVMASNPHSDCHYQQEDRLIIEQDWEKIFGFMGDRTSFQGPLQDLNQDNALVTGETYQIPFKLSYQYLAKLERDQLQKILGTARTKFLENIQLRVRNKRHIHFSIVVF